MDVEFHLPFSLPVPIVTTRNKHLHSLMLFQSYRGSEDVRAIVLVASWAIVVMMRKQSGKAYECVELIPDSRSETLNMAVAWVGIAG